jgi:hypothetical protein
MFTGQEWCTRTPHPRDPLRAYAVWVLQGGRVVFLHDSLPVIRVVNLQCGFYGEGWVSVYQADNEEPMMPPTLAMTPYELVVELYR